MRMEAVSRAKDNADRCPSCGGEVHRRPYSKMHAGSFISNGRRMEIRKRPAAGFANPIILDGLVQYWDGALYRSWPSNKYLARGGKSLHRRVWTAAFGNIPRDC